MSRPREERVKFGEWPEWLKKPLKRKFYEDMLKKLDL
jgi:hypothetical protein